MRIKYYISAIIILAGMGLWTYTAFASSMGPSFCGTSANDASVGAFAWSNTSNACANLGTYATATLTSGVSPAFDYSVKLVKGGTIGGSDKSTGTFYNSTDSTVSWGSSVDLWGNTFSASDINSSGFGVVYAAESDTAKISNYIKLTNFGFSIPIGATINGVVVSQTRHYSGGNGQNPNITNMTITVYYTTVSGNHQLQVKSGKLQIKSGKMIIQN